MPESTLQIQVFETRVDGHLNYAMKAAFDL